ESAAPKRADPTEDLDGGGNGDGHGGKRNGGAGMRLHAADEDWMAPNDEAEQAYEDGGGGHHAITDDGAATEVGNKARDETHAWEDGDVVLRVAEEPEEMQPEERRAVAMADDLAADPVSLGDEEGGAEVAIAEEQHERGEEHGEGEQNEDRRDQPRPYGKGHTAERHAAGALGKDGDENVDRAEPGADAEEADANEPAVHACALAGTCGS